MYILCMIILIFFAIIGLCAFITALVDSFYKASGETILTLKDLSADSAENRIRSTARICSHHKGMRLVCICDEDNPAYDICRLMQKEYPFLAIIPSDQEKEA